MNFFAGQPNYEDLQNNDMASGSSSGSSSIMLQSTSSYSLFLLTPWLSGRLWNSLWIEEDSTFHGKLVPQTNWPKNGPVSSFSTHILSSHSDKNSSSRSKSNSNNDDDSQPLPYRMGFHDYESGINLMCLSLTLILFNFFH